VKAEAYDVVNAFVKVAVEGWVFGEGDELGGGDLGGGSKTVSGQITQEI
jgi:hypothetical protein